MRDLYSQTPDNIIFYLSLKQETSHETLLKTLDELIGSPAKIHLEALSKSLDNNFAIIRASKHVYESLFSTILLPYFHEETYQEYSEATQPREVRMTAQFFIATTKERIPLPLQVLISSVNVSKPMEYCSTALAQEAPLAKSYPPKHVPKVISTITPTPALDLAEKIEPDTISALRQRLRREEAEEEERRRREAAQCEQDKYFLPQNK